MKIAVISLALVVISLSIGKIGDQRRIRELMGLTRTAIDQLGRCADLVETWVKESEHRDNRNPIRDWMRENPQSFTNGQRTFTTPFGIVDISKKQWEFQPTP